MERFTRQGPSPLKKDKNMRKKSIKNNSILLIYQDPELFWEKMFIIIIFKWISCSLRCWIPALKACK